MLKYIFHQSRKGKKLNLYYMTTDQKVKMKVHQNLLESNKKVQHLCIAIAIAKIKLATKQ